VYAGPQYVAGDWDVSPLFTAFNRWYGNRDYASGRGGRIDADFGITSAWQLSASMGGQYLNYATNHRQSGVAFYGTAQISFASSPSTTSSFWLGGSHQDAAPGYAYGGISVGGSYQHDVPFGFTAAFAPAYSATNYHGVIPGFGIARRDHTLVLQLNVINRRLDYHGFTPKFAYTYTDNVSNLPLYRYTRSQIDVGITSQF
jgi:hypothetical protein